MCRWRTDPRANKGEIVIALKANPADLALVSIHGRRLSIGGDGQTTTGSWIQLDNVIVVSQRPWIMKAAAGSNGAGGVTVAGTLVGDNVISVTDLSASPPADVSSSFEGTVSVAGQVQQTAATNLSAHGCYFVVQPQS